MHRMPWSTLPPDDDPRDARIAFGRGIRNLRLFHGWSQAFVGRRAGLDQSTISRLETGRNVPLRFRTVLRVLEALGVDRTVFKTRWEGASYLARSSELDPERLGPEPPKLPWLVHEPPFDPWMQPWVDHRDSIYFIDLVHAGLPDPLAAALVDEAVSVVPRFIDVRVLADND
jgi:transcriptional regulator with XRE-family HTH domain